jgi:hypothetical protein
MMVLLKRERIREKMMVIIDRKIGRIRELFFKIIDRNEKITTIPMMMKEKRKS